MGGIGFAQIMLLLERYRAYEAPVDSGLSLHYFVEASKRAYAQRSRIGADPDFMPAETTSSWSRDAPRWATLFSASRRRSSLTGRPLRGDNARPRDADRGAAPDDAFRGCGCGRGNAVSATVTQSAAFGSKGDYSPAQACS
jgi:gamma-glutamyltranspeptidase/glutathione hydrolase